MDIQSKDTGRSPQSPDLSVTSVSFVGIPSGDHASFCWDVTKEEFTRITGAAPEDGDESYFNEGLFRLYPNHVVPERDRQNPSVAFKFTMQIEPAGDRPNVLSQGMNTDTFGSASLPKVEEEK